MTSVFGFGQNFYDLSTIQTVEITFAQNIWDQLLDVEKTTTEDYILAQSISINGTVFDSIGVKYKGNSTYNSNQVKNPFHIELDTYNDHDYRLRSAQLLLTLASSRYAIEVNLPYFIVLKTSESNCD